MVRIYSFCFALLVGMSGTSWASHPTVPHLSVEDYLELPIEDLLSIEVMSVSRKMQSMARSPAAIYVITSEDIRRSGATSIPEALRLAPGVHVARIDANKWAIGIRGFNNIYANKLLVQMDGRSLYTPSYSGVNWDVQDTLLEDIDRIEVIRGPGATLWGANAVNGIINIITKNSSQTQGGLVTLGGGNEEKAFVGFRYGTSFNANTHGRVYFKHVARDDYVLGITDPLSGLVAGEDAGDDWKSYQAGFRLDGTPSASDRWTFQGDVYRNHANQLNLGILPVADSADSFNTSGWNFIARWHHQLSETSSTTLQAYYDHTSRDEVFIDQTHDTFDIDFQHHVQLGERHDLVWGLGYRRVKDDFGNTVQLALNPDRKVTETFSAFIQDEITLVKDKLYLTLGSKFENNDYTGSETQPNIRLLWQVNADHSLWASASRAVRTPSRVEEDGLLTVRVGEPSFYHGNPGFESEELTAYELGYRAQLTDHLSLDVALFSFDYEKLRTFELFYQSILFPLPSPPYQPGLFTSVLVPQLLWDNNMHGNIRGGELAIDWHPRDWWRIQASYSWLDTSFSIDRPSADPLALALEQAIELANEDSNPAEIMTLRSSMDLGDHWELDMWIQHVGRIPVPSISSVDSGVSVDAYTSLNARLAWKPRPNVELSISGYNLTDERHLEYTGESITPVTEVERSIYGQVRWKFQ